MGCRGKTKRKVAGKKPRNPFQDECVCFHDIPYLHRALICPLPLFPRYSRQVWLAQRGSLSALDSFDGFSLLCLAAFLLQERRLNPRYVCGIYASALLFLRPFIPYSAPL